MAKKQATARMPRKTKVGLQREAYDLLGIKEGDVLGVPKIEPLLKQSGLLEKVWSYLETSADEIARLLVAQKYKLSNVSQRNSVPFEAYCVAAGIETKRALGIIISEVYSQNEQAALLMASAAQPSVVQATIDRAIEAGGSRERDMLLKHSGFVPVPKTSVTIVRGGHNVIGDQVNQVAVLPPIESVVRQVSDRFNERLLSSAPPIAVMPELEEGEDAEEDNE